MNVESIGELGIFVDTVYQTLGGPNSHYAEDFKYIVGGCHCSPATEWYGNVYIVFKKVLFDKAVKNHKMAESMEQIVKQFSQWYK